MTAPESIEDLRATSDTLLRDLDVLAELEAQKRELAADDPRLVEMAERIREIATRVLSLSTRQRALTERVTAEAARPGVDAPSIEDVPARRVAAILADWREAERRLAAAAPGSAEAAEAEALVARFREEYREAYDRAQSK